MTWGWVNYQELFIWKWTNPWIGPDHHYGRHTGAYLVLIVPHGTLLRQLDVWSSCGEVDIRRWVDCRCWATPIKYFHLHHYTTNNSQKLTETRQDESMNSCCTCKICLPICMSQHKLRFVRTGSIFYNLSSFSKPLPNIAYERGWTWCGLLLLLLCVQRRCYWWHCRNAWLFSSYRRAANVFVFRTIVCKL